MIYVVETFQLSDEARAHPSFGEWPREFNSLVLERNPTVKSLNVYASYPGAFEMEVWFALEKWENFATYMKPLGRRIMLPVG
jgi:hypothetical protein